MIAIYLCKQEAPDADPKAILVQINLMGSQFFNSIIMKYQKIIKVLKNVQENNTEKVTNENDKEIPKER